MIPQIKTAINSRCTCALCDSKIKENTMTLYYLASEYRGRANNKHVHFTCWIKTQQLDIQAVLLLATTEQEVPHGAILPSN